MDTAKRKADLALFAGNVELCDITESLVFSDPYFDAPRNRHTSPELDDIVARLRADRDLKVAAQHMKHLFCANAQTMVHGDLHSGSIMVTDKETKVIDPEFAFYGPMALDTGMYFSNLWMSYFSQRGHEENGSRKAMRQWLFSTIVEAWSVFREEFSRLWRGERNGILYQRALFEDQGDWLGTEQALDHFLADLWADTLGFAGVEMHRRILGLAHNADFETIEDAGLRARCETGALELGRHLAVNRRHIHSIEEVNALAARIYSSVVDRRS
jgi:5-methylthioribose kinase